MKYWERGYRKDFFFASREILGEEVEKQETTDDRLARACEEHNISLNFDDVEKLEETVNQLMDTCE